MENWTERVDNLIGEAGYVIDFLPERVPKESMEQFWDVEYDLLNSRRYRGIRDRFVMVILKLMCYAPMAMQWNGWIDRPKPEQIENAAEEIMINHSGTLNCLFPKEEMLLVFEWDCLNLSVYHPSEKMQPLLEKIALSEGLFWRKAE